MIRIIGAICIFVSVSGAGIYLDGKIRERFLSICYIRDALKYLAINISVFDMPVKKALLNADRSAGREDILTNVSADMEQIGIKAAWEKAFFSNKARLCLLESDINTVIPLKNTLGTLDSEGEKRCIGGVVKSLDIIASQAENECRVKGTLYKKCSILLGIVAVIVLI